jgi:hypothetical protein
MEEIKITPEEKKSKGFVGIQEGELIVRVPLAQDDAEVIALGILERSKSLVQGYFYSKALEERRAAQVNMQASKGFIDRIMRRSH